MELVEYAAPGHSVDYGSAMAEGFSIAAGAALKKLATAYLADKALKGADALVSLAGRKALEAFVELDHGLPTDIVQGALGLRQPITGQTELLARRKRYITVGGPSGAGKSQLLSSLHDRWHYTDKPTGQPVARGIRVGDKKWIVNDLPGDPAQTGIDAQAEIASRPPDVLVLVFANRYLHTAGDEPLRRGRNYQAKDLEAYLAYCAEQEELWLSDLIKAFRGTKAAATAARVEHLIVTVNKLDIWGDRREAAVERYSSGRFLQLVEELAGLRQFSSQAQVTVHQTAARLGGFPLPTDHRQHMTLAAVEYEKIRFRVAVGLAALDVNGRE